MKVGDKFSTYNDFEKALSLYKSSVYNEYWIRDARTLSNQRKRFPETVNQCNENLKYYHIRLACVKGGRPFQSKNNKTTRKCSTLKQDCQASIFLRLSKCQKFLTVIEIKDEHNHSSSESYFASLSQQRLKLPKQETKKIKVGEKFSSYEDFEKAFALYKSSVCNEYWIRDARTLNNQRKRFPETVNQCNENLKYYYVRFACVKGGRPFKSKSNKTTKKCSTLKQDCQASIFLRLSKCQKYLTIIEVKDEHNHSSSKTYSNKKLRKFRILDKKCKAMAKLCCEVSTPVFLERLYLIQNIIKLWSEGKDLLLNEHIKSLIENKNIERCIETPIDRTISDQYDDFHAEGTVTYDEEISQSSMNEAGSLSIKSEEANSTISEPIIIKSISAESDEQVDFALADEHASVSNNSNDTYMKFEIFGDQSLSCKRKRSASPEEFSNASCQLPDTDATENAEEISFIRDPLAEKIYTINLRDIKMPYSSVLKRGRPKGLKNKVIGLKRQKTEDFTSDSDNVDECSEEKFVEVYLEEEYLD